MGSKQLILGLVFILGATTLSACNSSQTEPTNSPTAVPPLGVTPTLVATQPEGGHPSTSPPPTVESTPAIVPTPTAADPETESQVRPTSPSSFDVIYQGVSLTCDDAIASQVVPEIVPAVQDASAGPPLQAQPEHLRFRFDGYGLQETFHQPQIYVYPVQAFEAVNPMVESVVAGLGQQLAEKPAAPDNIPFLPFFNAAQVIRAQVAYLDFSSGSGVRFLTMYSQAAMPINNHELFYTFQGLTHDGRYYVAAVLPVSHPLLPADSSEVPGGDWNAFAQNFEGYVAETKETLDAQDGASFRPDLALLDGMVESLLVAPELDGALEPPITEGDAYPGWTRYANPDYGFAFHYPPTWTLEERPEQEGPGGQYARSLMLRQGTLRLVVQYKRADEGLFLGSGGMGAGDIVDRGSVSFLGVDIPKHVLVYEGKDKFIFYGDRFGDLEFYVALDDDPGQGVEYGAVDIPDQIQAEVDQILQSFMRLSP